MAESKKKRRKSCIKRGDGSTGCYVESGEGTKKWVS
jgi:hypothetical protein